MKINKTITVATKDGDTRIIEREPNGWPKPPEDNPYGEGWIDGGSAYMDACKLWRQHGWKVERKPNPNYRGHTLSRFIRR